jgi:hypothetical protein
VLYLLEQPSSPKKQTVPLDDVFAISYALGVAPIHMMIPIEDDDVVRVTETEPLSAKTARAWFRGELPLGLGDGREDLEAFYKSEAPAEEQPSSPTSHGPLRKLRLLIELLSREMDGLPPDFIHDPTKLDDERYTNLATGLLHAEQVAGILVTTAEEAAKEIRNKRNQLQRWRVLPPDFESTDATQPSVEPLAADSWITESVARRKRK